MGKSRRKRAKPKKQNNHVTIYIPAEEREEMVRWIPNLNWSEIAGKAFRDTVAEMKRLREMKSQE